MGDEVTGPQQFSWFTSPMGVPQWTLTHGANDQKELLLWHQNNYRPPSAHNSIMRNIQLWMAGDFHSSALCRLTLTACFGKASGKLSQSDCAQVVTGANKTGFTQHNFPNAKFSPIHSTLWWVMDPSPFSWEQQSLHPFGSPSAAADSSTRLPGQGTQRRQSRGPAPYAHLAWQLQLCIQLHC